MHHKSGWTWRVESATAKDVTGIHKLITNASKDYVILSRSLNDIYSRLNDFLVCRDKLDSTVIGCICIQPTWTGTHNEVLVELRSLVADPGFRRKGLGETLVKYALRKACELRIRKAFVLTCDPKFFNKLGFEKVEKKRLSRKVWTDCIECSRLFNCPEVAMMCDTHQK